MALVEKIEYLHEPTDLQCGQAVIAMLTGKDVVEVINICGTDRETDLKQMFLCLEHYGINFNRTRVSVNKKKDLPFAALLSLETPRCWHWSLYYDGVFYDPEHGVLKDFPISNRRYYWEIYK